MAAIPSGNASWGNRLISAALVGVITVTILAAVAFYVNLYFNNPPLVVDVLTQPPMEPVCPGERYVALVRTKTSKTVIVLFYMSNQTLGGAHIVVKDQAPTFSVPHLDADVFVQPVEWIVPDAPPGQYKRVLGIRGHDTDEIPLVQEQLYRVGDKEMCKNKKLNGG